VDNLEAGRSTVHGAKDLRFVSKMLNDMYDYIFLQKDNCCVEVNLPQAEMLGDPVDIINKDDVNKSMDILCEHIAFDLPSNERSTVQTFKQYEDERIYHLQLIFEYQQKEILASETILELSRKVRRLTKELNESRKIVEMRRAESKRYKDDNKNLRGMNRGLLIECGYIKEDNEGFC
jgi:hypothetical protein